MVVVAELLLIVLLMQNLERAKYKTKNQTEIRATIYFPEGLEDTPFNFWSKYFGNF